MNSGNRPSRSIQLCLLLTATLTAALAIALPSSAAPDIQFVDVSGARGIGSYTSPLG